MVTVTVDPGDNTGVAIWRNDQIVETVFFNLKGKEKKQSVADRHHIMCRKFLSAVAAIDTIDKFIIEGVSLWGQSTKSQAAALRGDTFRLAYLVGGYVNVIQTIFPSCDVQVVDVREWKGSLPTDALIREVTLFTGNEPTNEHVACAIGIGMHAIGKL
jgi:hypothetical protein